MPSTEDRAAVRMNSALNCWPWVRSLIHSPDAVIHRKSMACRVHQRSIRGPNKNLGAVSALFAILPVAVSAIARQALVTACFPPPLGRDIQAVIVGERGPSTLLPFQRAQKNSLLVRPHPQ